MNHLTNREIKEESIGNVIRLSRSLLAQEDDETEDNSTDKKPKKDNEYKLKSYALVFTSKQPHDYTKIGQDETFQSIYEKGESFSVKGDNFSWLNIGVLFEFKNGEKTGEAVYSRPLNPDASYDPQGVPQLKGIQLDPVGVKSLESQLKIFSSNTVKLPPAGNPILAEAPSEGINRMSFDENTMEQLLKGRFPAGLKKISGVDFAEKYDSFNYRINLKGKLHSVFRQPIAGNQGSPEDANKDEKKEPEKDTFEPVDEQEKKMEKRMSGEKETESYETGGFDIMKQLVKRQRKNMPIRKASEGKEALTTTTSPSSPADNNTNPDKDHNPITYNNLEKQKKKLLEKAKLTEQMADKVKQIEQMRHSGKTLKLAQGVLKKYFLK